jgi:hypothetical protein
MLNSKIADSHLLGSWKQTWEKWPKEFSSAKWQDSSWREPFQLLSAALIYSYNGLINFPQSRLHSRGCAACGSDSVWKKVLSGCQLPCFTSQERQELFATMHFASSSFRICTALFLITKSVRGPLAEFLKQNCSDWKRNKLENYLKQATSLDCCKKSKNNLTKGIALAMIVAHRDEFGHGEKGQGANWVQNRGQLFSQLYPCRILQAQLFLIDLGRNALTNC